MTIPVLWLSLKEETPHRGYWDQAILEDIFSKKLWDPAGGYDFEHYEFIESLPTNSGAVVVIPARHHAELVQQVNEELSYLPWCLVILVGDEEASFPVDQLDHPKMKIYVMTPQFGKYQNIDRYIGDGYTPEATKLIQAGKKDAGKRPYDWFFAGQVTHSRREDCIKQLRDMPNGFLVETAGFTQGMPREEYLKMMAAARIIPCPSGPVTQDTFRLYEALEAGCVPIADSKTPNDTEPTGYWEKLLGDVPFPVIDDWADLPGLVGNLRDRYPTINNRVFAWWQRYKRNLAYNVRDDIAELSGMSRIIPEENDDITVLIPTSPIQSHPDTFILDETIKSIRDRLPRSEIIIMFDGVREEQESYRERYEAYIRKVLWKCNFDWHNVLPMISDEHKHQANLTREALKLVRTPTILFVEHDTPLCGEIPFDQLTAPIINGLADVIRLHHEALILDVHKHLMIGERQDVLGIPLQKTYQWSQRPHLASTTFYRKMIDDHFTPASRTMIEDKMHGVVHEAYIHRKKAGWNEYKLWVYVPDGDIKRSTHTDGRQNDPKFEMVY